MTNTDLRPRLEFLIADIVYNSTSQTERLVLSPPMNTSKENQYSNVPEPRVRKNITRGTFYSKTTSELGSWFCDETCIRFKWDSSGRTVELFQVSLTSEIEWRSDSSETGLKFTNLKGTKFLPSWVMPRNPEDMKSALAKESKNREVRNQIDEGRARGAIASEYNECALCFFQLHLVPAAILRYQSKRSCEHYLHSICAEAYKTRLEKRNERLCCPICYKRFTEVKTLPDLLRDPRLWFQLCDTDLTGSLDRKEVLEGLLAVLPVDRVRLEKSINDSWSNWDASGDGSIELQEFIDPNTGLKAFLVKNYNIFRKLESSDRNSTENELVPSLDAEPRKWFDYWDYNRSGTLERIEVARALIKTFCVTTWGDPIIHRANDIAELTFAIWNVLGYSSRAKLTFEEFMKPYGLADQVIHNVTHGQFFGEDH